MIHPWNPWEELREHWEHVTLHYAPSLEVSDALAYTDGAENIWILDGLTVAERRCTLTHELIHLERRDEGHQGDKIERLVEREAARRLIPLDNLLEADWAQPLEKIADDLWVDEATLEVRLATLGEAERDKLHERLQASRGEWDGHTA